RGDERRPAAARQGLALIANLERVIPTGGEWSEAGVVEGRMRQRCGVEQLRAARPRPPRPPCDGDAGALRREPPVHDPAVERTAVIGVCEHHDAVAADPLGENREIADRQRVGQALGLAPTEDEHGAIAGEILPGEMRIEPAVLHTIARRVPRSRRGFEGDGIGERQVNDEKAPRLRLTSCNEQQQEETQAPHRRGSTRRLYFRSAARSRSCGSAYTRMPLMPVIVSAATMALTIASSVAWIVAWKSGSIRSFGSIVTLTLASGFAAPGLAVEKATKMSPDGFPPVPPSRPTPRLARLAIRLS